MSLEELEIFLDMGNGYIERDMKRKIVAFKTLQITTEFFYPFGALNILRDSRNTDF